MRSFFSTLISVIALIGIVDTLGEGRKITLDYTSNSKGDLVKLTVTSKGIAPLNSSSPDRVTTVNLTALKNVLRADQPAGIPTYDQLFPDDLIQKAISFGTFNPRVISSIELPSGHKWEFKYNVYGEIAYVKTPSLGAIEYDYGPNASDPDSPGGFDRSRLQIFRRVQERRTYPNSSSGQIEGRTTYGDPKKDYTNGIASIREKHFNAGTDLLADTKHQYWGIPETTGTGTFGYQDWRIGKEVTTVEIDPARGPLRETDYEFHNRDGRNWPSLQSIDKDLHPQNDPVLTKTTNKLLDTNETATVEHVYDQYNNIRKEIAKGFDGQPIRETDRDFIDSATYTSAPIDNTLTNRKPHIRNLVSAETIKGKDGIETVTTFDYDNYSLVTPVGADATNIQATQANGYDSNYNLRGNLTQVTAGTNSSDLNDKPNVQSHYDIFGNVVEVSGPLQNQVVTTEYDPTFFFAYPTKTHQTVVGGSSDNQFLQVQRDYDYYTGALLKSIGFNGEEIRYEYVDPLDRITKEIRPTKFGQTTYTYSVPGTFPAEVKVENTIDSSQSLNFVSYNRYDGLLRTIEQERVESAGNVKVTSEYDGLGRTSKVTNPSRGDGATTDGFTTTAYDGLSRVLMVKTTGSEGNTGTVTTDYLGSTVTVTDQTGKKRKSQTDALGRLLTVFEPITGGALTQNTDYDYDARGNLQHVHQGVQTRTFTYDVLSRLRTASAPESGITTYTYDAASNLKTRTDGRGIITNYDYDSLNRIIKKTYNDLTPDVEYFYDRMPINLPNGVTPPISYSPGFSLGRLVATASPTTIRQKATANFYKYDIGGRIENSQELLDEKYYPFTMQYNEGSLPTSWTTPTQAVTNYSYNNSAEVTSVVRNGMNLSNGIQYTASGSVKQQTLGNGLLHSMSYNSRLQPTIISLGTTADPTAKMKLEYDYGFHSFLDVQNLATTQTPLDKSQNNGNIGRITLTHGTGANPIEQNFAYDELNRLQLAKEFFQSTVAPVYFTIYNNTLQRYDYLFSSGDPSTGSIYTETGLIDLTNPAFIGQHPEILVLLQAYPSSCPGSSATAEAKVNGITVASINNTEHVPFIGTTMVAVDLSPYVGTVVNLSTSSSRVDGPISDTQPCNDGSSYCQIITSRDYLTIPLAPTIEVNLSAIEISPNTYAITSYGDPNRNERISISVTGSSANTSGTIIDNGPQNSGIKINSSAPEDIAHLSASTTEPGNSGRLTITGITTILGRTEVVTDTLAITNYNDNGGGNGNPDSIILPQQTKALKTYQQIQRNRVGKVNEYNNRISSNTSFISNNDIHPLTDPSVSWQQEYTYDRYGNRTNVNDLDGDHMLSINTNNNRITTTGIVYDDAGNVKTDVDGKTYEYDAENHMISAVVGGVTTNYYYDGQGKRIKKDVMGVVTRFIYDGTGKLALEYEGDIADITQATKEYVYGAAGMQVVIEPQETDPNKRFQYMTADHLGSPRVITDAAGNVISRRDFYPFGEDIASSIGGRAIINGFSSMDNIRQKFTGYERDDETGLDFAQARYFGSMQGRFLSADPFAGSGKAENPQTWNRYTYVLNNPIKDTDPLGLDPNDGDKKTITERIQAAAAEEVTNFINGAKEQVLHPYDSTANTVIQLSTDTIERYKTVGNAIIHPVDTATKVYNSITVENVTKTAVNTGLVLATDKLIDTVGKAVNKVTSTYGNKGVAPRTSAPFLPDDPYSKESVDSRRSNLRKSLNTGNNDPNSPIPSVEPGKIKGAEQLDYHDTGERNVGTQEEHSRVSKGSNGLPKNFYSGRR